MYTQETSGQSCAIADQPCPSWLIITSQHHILVANCWCQLSGQGCWGCPPPHCAPCSHRCHQVTGNSLLLQLKLQGWHDGRGGHGLTVVRIGNPPPLRAHTRPAGASLPRVRSLSSPGHDHCSLSPPCGPGHGRTDACLGGLLATQATDHH